MIQTSVITRGSYMFLYVKQLLYVLIRFYTSCSHLSLRANQDLNTQLLIIDTLFIYFLLLSQPIFTMSAQQNQLQNVTPAEFLGFLDLYKKDAVSFFFLSKRSGCLLWDFHILNPQKQYTENHFISFHCCKAPSEMDG